MTHRHLITRVGAAAAAAAVALALAAPAGASSRATASESAFCHTLLTFHSKEPTGETFSAWQKWAKTYLPFWEKLANEAPSAGAKNVLNELVTVVKYEANSKTWTQLAAYVAAHEKWWANGWTAFAKDAEACAVAAA